MTNCPTRLLGVKLSSDHCLYAAIKRYGLANVNEFKVTLGIVIAGYMSEQAGPSCYRLSAKDLLELLLNNFATDLNSISSGFSGDKTK